MDKDLITVAMGFHTPELDVTFIKSELQNKGSIYNRDMSEYYKIIFIQKNNLRFVSSKYCTDLSPGDIIIAQPFEDISLLGYAKNRFYEFVEISFHQSYFSNIKGDNNYLRAFVDRKKGEKNIYRKNEFMDFSINECIMKSFKKYIEKNLGIVHFCNVLGMLITQITFCFDKKNDYIPSVSSDEYKVKIYDYILRNYCTVNCVTKISKKFSVSDWYVNKTCERFYGMSFHQTIRSLRMWNAKELMTKDIDLNKISSLCGYNDYSGFYRCYTKFFGVTPKEDIKHLKLNGIFLSHSNKF